MNCAYCGYEVGEADVFCSNCGKPIGDEPAAAIDERKTEWQGSVHKCPNCGETLASFTAFCPSCGYELRNINAPRSMKEFNDQLKKAENPGQRILLIREYPVPNAREDVLEFMIAAASNMANGENDAEMAAWSAKFEQCYQKARLSFGGMEGFAQIDELYRQSTERAEKSQAIQGMKKVLRPAMHPLVIFVVAVLLVFELIRLVSGQFAGMDVIFDALILWAVLRAAGKLQAKS